jgi:hypothetical protein
MTVAQLAGLALLGSLPACAPTTARASQDCPAPASLDSLVAEIRRDTVDVFPAGGLANRRVAWNEDLVLLGPLGQRASVYVAETTPRYTGFYRIGLIHQHAYRLRGWPCDNLGAWLRSLPPFSAASGKDVWLAIHRLASALNPIGDSAKVLDPTGVTSLPSPLRLSALDVPAVVAPSLERAAGDAEWRGQVTVFWYHSRSHGLKAAVWAFRFDDSGRLSYLREQPVGPVAGDTARVLLGRDGRDPP